MQIEIISFGITTVLVWS